MNEVSIIINGVRYDTATPRYADDSCDECDLADFCQKAEMHSYTCPALIGIHRCFKKSDKQYMQNFSTFLNNFPDPNAVEQDLFIGIDIASDSTIEQKLIIGGIEYR